MSLKKILWFSFLFCLSAVQGEKIKTVVPPPKNKGKSQNNQKNVFSAVLEKKQLIRGLVRVFVKAYVPLKDINPDIPMDHPESLPGIFQNSLQYLARNHLLGKLPLVSRGTGFITEKKNHHVFIVTNYHVVAPFLKNKNPDPQNPDEYCALTIIFFDNTEALGEVVGADEMWDIAILRVVPSGETFKTLKALSWGKSQNLKQGDWVMAIGNPLGYANSVHHGIVSYEERTLGKTPMDLSSEEDIQTSTQKEPVVDHHHWIQTDIPIQKGNSGGPLFNIQGYVMGINTLFVTKNGAQINVSMAIPAHEAIPIISVLKNQGCLQRGYIGLHIKNLDEPFVLHHNLPLGVLERGVLIHDVSGAHSSVKKLLKPGDIILQINGQDILHKSHMANIIASKTPGSFVTMRLLRQEKKKGKTTGEKSHFLKNVTEKSLKIPIGSSPKSMCSLFQ